MRKMKTLIVLLIAASFLWISAPSAHALSLAPRFGEPFYMSVKPGGANHLLCTASSTRVKAVVEQITSVGKITGPYYFNMPLRGLALMGEMTETYHRKELLFSYYDGSPGNAMLFLHAENTTSPIDVKVTFYDLSK